MSFFIKQNLQEKTVHVLIKKVCWINDNVKLFHLMSKIHKMKKEFSVQKKRNKSGVFKN